MVATIPISRGPRAGVHPSTESQPQPVSSPESDLWIFRAGGRMVSGPAMLAELSRQISRIAAHPESLLDAMIQAGQFEAALADADSPEAIQASSLTDVLALGLGDRQLEAEALELAARIRVPEFISVSPPEGFSYYALHPADFSRIVAHIPAEPRTCAVIGIRSIGTTLSAVTAAGLKAEGRKASRITVRPTGHPYARTMEFNDRELRWIGQQISTPAQFLIVDEGPGRSGSTFLSVAEALVRAGVPQGTITIVGSREPNPEALYAVEAASRWKAFRFLATVPSVSTRFERHLYIGGGEWRNVFLPDRGDWPESWTQMERLKFIAPDHRTLIKFEGMGPIGQETRERAFALAEAGFCPPVVNAGDGFLEYSLVPGRRLRPADLSTTLLEQIARYCAFRASAFPSRESVSTSLREMVQFNLGQEFGVELSLPESELVPLNPVLSDGRMQPHEWIATDTDGLCKTDGISHGDDHFFPGPCDIAWDLAGAAIEWELSEDGISCLLEQFRRHSGIDVSSYIQLYLLAYSLFRLGFSKMAIPTVQGSNDEVERLRSAYDRYRRRAGHLIRSISNSSRQGSSAA